MKENNFSELTDREIFEMNYDFHKLMDRYSDEVYDDSVLVYEDSVKTVVDAAERKRIALNRQADQECLEAIRYHKSKAQKNFRKFIASQVREYYELFGYQDTPSWPFLFLVKDHNYENIPLNQWMKLIPELYMMLRTLRLKKSGLY